MPLLHYAVLQNKYDAVEALSTLPYFDELTNDDSFEDGWTPLLTAVTHSSRTDLKVFRFLADHGAHVLKPKKLDGMTALHIAATTNDVHVVDFILDHVDNPSRAVNIKTNEGWTPSHFAGFFNNFDSLNLLLEAGADLSIECDKGLTTFDEIVRNDHKDLFECVFPYAKKIKRDSSVVSISKSNNHRFV